MFEVVCYEARTLKMVPGDRVVMFSDGILDAMGPGSLADKEARLLGAAGTGADVAGIWAALAIDGAASRKPDDMTCLVVQRES